MFKQLGLLVLVILILIVPASSASAYGGFGGGPAEDCLRSGLDEGLQDQLESIISGFRQQMTLVREKMTTARNSGDTEARDAARERRLQLMEEKRAALNEILPEEMTDRFEHPCKGMRNFGAARGKGNNN